MIYLRSLFYAAGSWRAVRAALGVAAVVAVLVTVVSAIRQVRRRETEFDDIGTDLAKQPKTRNNGIAILAVGGLVAAIALARNPIPFEGMGMVSFAIIFAIWVASAAASAALVKRNYNQARALLVPLSAASREFRLVRLVFTIPIYTVVNHLLILAFLSERFSDNIWGAESVFDKKTMLTPVYLAFCGVVLAGGCAGGGFALIGDKKWDEAYFWKFTGACAGGGAGLAAVAVAVYLVWTAQKT